MAATTTTCSGFFNLRSSSSSSSNGCGGKLNWVAMSFINGVTMAFFASLNRCSCIRIATEEEDGDGDDANPLMFNDGNLRHDGVDSVTATTSRRRNGKGKKNGK
uniref:Uncharacterized protein LOC101496334 n=1 Tax=Cicer arietinum TaxID=3827 RepID=A0A1S2YB48_CICAR|nr:uncharacterized protein LOC101496334 [Cicer arietinum]